MSDAASQRRPRRLLADPGSLPVRPTIRPMTRGRAAVSGRGRSSGRYRGGAIGGGGHGTQSQTPRSVRRQRRKKRIKETVNCCKHFLAFMFSNLGLSSLIVLYVILGGAIFQRLEQDDEVRVKQKVNLLLNTTVSNISLQLITDAQQLCPPEQLACRNFSLRLAADGFEGRFLEKLREYSRQLIQHLTDDGWNGRFDETELNWSFSGALLYVVTVITTIGYGQVVPKTQGGYMLTMLYAFFGIPLTFLYLNNVGDNMADAFRLFYRDAFRPFWRRIFRKRTRQRARTLALEWQRAVAAKIPISLSHMRLHRLTERLQAWTADNLGDSDDRQDEADAPDNQPLLAMSARPMTLTPLFPTTTTSVVGRPLIESKLLHLPSSAATIRIAYVVARVLPARGVAGQDLPAPTLVENGDCCGMVNPLMDEVQTPISQKAIMDWTSDELHQVPLIDWDDIDRELEQTETAGAGANPAAGNNGAVRRGDLAESVTGGSGGAGSRLRRTRSAPLAAARTRSLSPPLSSPPPPCQSPPPSTSSTTAPTTATPTASTSATVEAPPRRRPISLSMSALGADTDPHKPPSWVLARDGGSNPMLRRCSYVSVHEPPTPTTPTMVEDDDDKDSMQGLSLRQVTVPLSLSVSVMVLYIIFGALIFTIWEQDKNYIRWSYFCFVTLSTIGFGDIVPGTKVDSENPKEKLVATVIYVAIGLSVFAMCFKLMQEEVIQKVRRFGRRIAAIRDRLNAGEGPATGLNFARVNGLLERLRTPRTAV